MSVKGFYENNTNTSQVVDELTIIGNNGNTCELIRCVINPKAIIVPINLTGSITLKDCVFSDTVEVGSSLEKVEVSPTEIVFKEEQQDDQIKVNWLTVSGPNGSLRSLGMKFGRVTFISDFRSEIDITSEECFAIACDGDLTIRNKKRMDISFKSYYQCFGVAKYCKVSIWFKKSLYEMDAGFAFENHAMIAI